MEASVMAKTKKGTENPTAYTTIYQVPTAGFAMTNATTEANMGPIQGVQPAAKINPTKTDPRYPNGLETGNRNLRSLISHPLFSTPVKNNPSGTDDK